ncbi:MAG TPA: hypothetical protein ENH01_07980 [Nitrospirae bacterium]|nr:hypothetical protein [Nitrospirota bacterium]
MGKNKKKKNRPQTKYTSFDELGERKYGIKKETRKKMTDPRNRRGVYNGNAVFPYDFAERETVRKKPEQFHDRLLPDKCDIAFEIEWKALTPLALNPCIDYAAEPSCPKKDKDTDYAGYNRRWLMIGNRPAISPFTVKSAIANAYANLMGACYRVNTKKEKHRNYESGQYPYPGRYKRYRVAMDWSSKPGIILEIREQDDGSRYVKIQPVKEFYSNKDLRNSSAI